VLSGIVSPQKWHFFISHLHPEESGAMWAVVRSNRPFLHQIPRAIALEMTYFKRSCSY
jgi:hypothetical protein